MDSAVLASNLQLEGCGPLFNRERRMRVKFQWTATRAKSAVLAQVSHAGGSAGLARCAPHSTTIGATTADTAAAASSSTAAATTRGPAT